MARAAVVVGTREPGPLQVVAEEIAAAVFYLASEAGFTTGAVLNVNGGSWMS